MFVRSSLASLSIALLLAACTVDAGSPGGSAPSSGGATGAQVDQCKESCNKMKFFDCNSADEQARCYGDCDKASSSQVQLFVGCASSSICDPACRTNIVPADQPKTGSGASSPTCTSACEKIVSCSFIPLSKKDACISECLKSGYQYQIDCVNKSECGEIPKACGLGEKGGETGEVPTLDAGMSSVEVMDCQSECDTLNFFDCVNATEHASCRSKCTTASSEKRTTFSSCVKSGGSQCTKLQDCLASFGG